MPAPAIIVHSLDDARTALAAARDAGRPVTLLSAPGAAAHAGAAWFRRLVEIAAAEHPEVTMTAVLDCADDAGHVMGALREGVRRVRFTGPPDVAAKLSQIARVQDAELVVEAIPALDLRGSRDPRAAARAYLAGFADD